MTQNQIAFFNAQETKRHNMMYEQEQHRHQLADEAIRARANAIQATMNYVNATHYKNQDAETRRSNLAHEYLTSQQLAETSRHNKATEAITKALNASMITRNMAEASYATENTKYVQEMTRTQAEETKKRASEAQAAAIGVGTAAYERMKVMNEGRLASARAGLASAQAQTQWTYGFRNFTSGINDVANALHQVAGTATNLFTFGFGDTGVSTMQQQNMDWYNNLNSYALPSGSTEDYFSGGISVQEFTGNPNYYQ